MRPIATTCLLIAGVGIAPAAAHAFTRGRCTAAEHAEEAREPRPALMLSGLATMTAGVAALASGEHSTLATIYLLNAPSLSLLVGILAIPCEIDPQLPERAPPSLEERHRYRRDANRSFLWVLAFNTAVAGSAVLLSQNDTSRIVSGIATGVSAISPLLYLDRFFDDDTSATGAVRLGPATQITFRF